MHELLKSLTINVLQTLIRVIRANSCRIKYLIIKRLAKVIEVLLFLLEKKTNICNAKRSTTMKEKIYTQKEIMEILIPELKSNGLLYKKNKAVFARKAKPGEQINTLTSDGLETMNTAEKGDFVIKNQTAAKEMYIISGSKFKKRYEWIKKGENDFSTYKPKGKVIAVELTNAFLKKMKFKREFYFIAPWKEQMIAKKGDFLVCPPDYSEIYRIARKEFFETYQIEK